MEDPAKILRANGVEIDLGDHRSPMEIARALGLIAIIESPPPEVDETAQPQVLAKRPKGSPYLAY